MASFFSCRVTEAKHLQLLFLLSSLTDVLDVAGHALDPFSCCA
jgi:hypothetical protein